MLKTARILAQIGLVFSIISLVICGIYTVAFGGISGIILEAIKEQAAASGDVIPDSVLAIIPTIFMVTFVVLDVIMILSIVFTNKLLKKIKNGCAKHDMIANCVLGIIFGPTFTQIAAILVLAAPQKQFDRQ